MALQGGVHITSKFSCCSAFVNDFLLLVESSDLTNPGLASFKKASLGTVASTRGGNVHDGIAVHMIHLGRLSSSLLNHPDKYTVNLSKDTGYRVICLCG
jgi:hypothetical protein